MAVFTGLRNKLFIAMLKGLDKAKFDSKFYKSERLRAESKFVNCIGQPRLNCAVSQHGYNFFSFHSSY